jgi:hypothetical protein
MDITAVADGAPFQQVAVARQDDPLLGRGEALDLAIGEPVAVDRVEARQPQQPRQRAEMGVGDEAGGGQRRAQAERQERRIDGDPVAGAQSPVEVDRFAIDQDQRHLGMRHAAALDEVLDRHIGRGRPFEVALPAIGGDEIVQFGVEAQAHHCRDSISIKPPAAGTAIADRGPAMPAGCPGQRSGSSARCGRARRMRQMRASRPSRPPAAREDRRCREREHAPHRRHRPGAPEPRPDACVRVVAQVGAKWSQERAS